VKLAAIIRSTETSTVEGEGADYEAARSDVDRKIPEGHQVLSYRRVD